MSEVSTGQAIGFLRNLSTQATQGTVGQAFLCDTATLIQQQASELEKVKAERDDSLDSTKRSMAMIEGQAKQIAELEKLDIGRQKQEQYLQAKLDAAKKEIDEAGLHRAALEQVLLELEEQNRWIPVSERLPEKKDEIDRIYTHEEWCTIQWLAKDGSIYFGDVDLIHRSCLRYTHWKPITLPTESEPKCKTCKDTHQVGNEIVFQGRSMGFKECPDCKESEANDG